MTVVTSQLDRLQSTLMTTGLQTKDPSTFQVLNELIKYLRSLSGAVTDVQNTTNTTVMISTTVGASGISEMMRNLDDSGDYDWNDGSLNTNQTGLFTQGSVIFEGPSGLAQNNTYFTWDNTNLILNPTTIKAIGYIQVGPNMTFPGIAGDLQVNRGGVSPGTGAIYFGNTGSHFIEYTGTQFFYADAVSSNGGFLTPTGIVSNFVGKVLFGPNFSPSGVDGDITVSRGGASPGTGVIYFGNSAGAHNISFTGAQFNISDNIYASAGVTVPASQLALLNRVQTGPTFTFPGTDGDIVVNRGGGSPGSGVIYFGSSAGSHYLYYDGTQYNFTDKINVSGVIQGNGALVLGGKTTTYNNIATVGWGQPTIYAYNRPTGQVAAIASVSTYTVGASDGSFYVSANVNVTTSTLHTFTVICTYTDETNTSRILTMTFSQLTGALVTAITNATGAGAYEGIPLHIRCKASTTITLGTTGTFTTVVYNVEASIMQIA